MELKASEMCLERVELPNLYSKSAYIAAHYI